MTLTRANLLPGVISQREALEVTAELEELQGLHDGLMPAFKKLATAESAAMERLLDPELI